MTLSNVLLPAPDGPKIAVNCPDLKSPLTPLKIVLFPVKHINKLENVHSK